MGKRREMSDVIIRPGVTYMIPCVLVNIERNGLPRESEFFKPLILIREKDKANWVFGFYNGKSFMSSIPPIRVCEGITHWIDIDQIVKDARL
jgi:hypothetical protein